MKKIAIIQSNYIPWKGYFDMIASVDEFIIFDEMQYTKRDWRNRNQIKTSQGMCWLTVPVNVKKKSFQKIADTEIDGDKWVRQHWNTIELNYKRADFYKEVESWLKPLYFEESYTHISQLNIKLIQAICLYLGINTKITTSSDYHLVDGKNEKLISLCHQSGATEYVTGPSAKSYIDESMFGQANIKLTWFDYSNYPQYPQLWGGFVHEVTILDLLFNCGRDAAHFMNRSRLNNINTLCTKKYAT